MPIPEHQLSSWSHQGAVTTAASTYASIQSALEAYAEWPHNIDYEVYLQGSYCNDTNIRGDSDVDVVVQLNSSFQHDISALSAAQQLRFHSHFPDALYTWSDLRNHVLRALIAHYGASAVREGKKSLKVSGTPWRLPADVVAAMQYRKYFRFHDVLQQDYAEGMIFYVPSEVRWIVNYPKLHYHNGVEKNRAYVTGGQFKPLVRVFKNMREYLVDHSLMPQGLAPSYFLECLLYNAPNETFDHSIGLSVYQILCFLQGANLTSLVCQNGQEFLCGNGPDQWPVSKAQQAIASFVELWNSWAQQPRSNTFASLLR